MVLVQGQLQQLAGRLVLYLRPAAMSKSGGSDGWVGT